MSRTERIRHEMMSALTIECFGAGVTSKSVNSKMLHSFKQNEVSTSSTVGGKLGDIPPVQ